MRLPSSRLVLVSSLCLALAACGDDDDATSNGNGNGNGNGVDAGFTEPEGDHHTYVLSELEIPESATQATQLGLDLDGDGEVDNALGLLIQAAGSAFPDLDLGESVAEQLEAGAFIVLADLQATSLVDAQNAAFWVYLGANPGTDPCQAEEDCGYHLDGETTFDVDSSSPTDARVDGVVIGGSFSGGPGNVSVTLTFEEVLPQPLTVDLIGARVEIESVSETGLVSGKLAGAISMEQIETEFFPVIAEAVTALIESECDVEGGDPEPCGCPEDSIADELQKELDPDDTCTVSTEDVAEHDLVSVLQPDVDLLDENGNFDPTPEDDPEWNPDSISLGVGFSTVGAVFTSPQE